MSLYTLHRPHDWESVVGQKYTKDILQTAMRMDKVGHAYILHGARGTGKTTSARILAQGVNCTNLQNGNPCHTCKNCLDYIAGRMIDVIEIDAASNTGVDNIRDLIETARYEPTQGTYKVYIIDEVHMLSKGAFNALLKIMEEPPAYVKFILATTEIEKVPETIRSRAQRFDFRKISREDIVKQLQYICGLEHIQAEEKALSTIARVAKGGMRDAITLLEQNIVEKQVTFDHVRNAMSLVDEDILGLVLQILVSGDREKLKTMLTKMQSQHIDVRMYMEELLYTLRDRIFAESDTHTLSRYMHIFSHIEKGYARIRSTPDTFMLLEMVLLGICMPLQIPEIRNHGGETPKKNTDKVYISPAVSSRAGPEISIPTPEHVDILDISPLKKEAMGISVPTPEHISASPPTPLHSVERGDSSASSPIETVPTLSIHTHPAVSSGAGPDISVPTASVHTDKTLFSYARLVSAAKDANPALGNDLKASTYTLVDTHLTIKISTQFAYDRLNTAKYISQIVDICTRTFDTAYTVSLELGGANTLQKDIHEVF